MYAKRTIIGLIVLISIGGVLTALYQLAGGQSGSVPASFAPGMNHFSEAFVTFPLI